MFGRKPKKEFRKVSSVQIEEPESYYEEPEAPAEMPEPKPIVRKQVQMPVEVEQEEPDEPSYQEILDILEGNAARTLQIIKHLRTLK